MSVTCLGGVQISQLKVKSRCESWQEVPIYPRERLIHPHTGNREKKEEEEEIQCCRSTMCNSSLSFELSPIKCVFSNQGFKGVGWGRAGDIRQVPRGGNSIVAKSCGLQKAKPNEESL